MPEDWAVAYLDGDGFVHGHYVRQRRRWFRWRGMSRPEADRFAAAYNQRARRDGTFLRAEVARVDPNGEVLDG